MARLLELMKCLQACQDIEIVEPEIEKELEPITQNMVELSNTVNNVTTQITRINSNLTWNELV